MIIDSHVHIAKTPETLQKTLPSVLKSLLVEMKNSRTDHALVIASIADEDKDYFPDTKQILTLTKDVKNLSVIGAISIPDFTKADLQVLEEWLRKKIIVGVKLYPGYQYFYPSDAVCHPIYKLCLKHDVPVIFHTGDTYSINGSPKVKYSHPLHIDEVAADFPDLKIVIAHMGNPWLVDCSEVLYKNKNVYADLSGLVVGDSLKTPYGKLMKQRIQELIWYSSPRKLLYGTDWPLAGMAGYVSFVKSLDISKQDFDFIFYKNAATLFKLDI